MENKRLSLANLQGRLSRAEMKNILAGDESLGDSGTDPSSCNVYCDKGYACKGKCSSCEGGAGLGDRKMCVQP